MDNDTKIQKASRCIRNVVLGKNGRKQLNIKKTNEAVMRIVQQERVLPKAIEAYLGI